MSRIKRQREPLTRDRVLRAAVEVVDREGLEALSMRRLGEALGVEAMSLYRYVPSKAALLDGVHEAILAEVVVPERGRDWTVTVRAYARAFRAALVAHPNALAVFALRPAVTPASLEHVEAGLAVFRAAGFSIEAAVASFQVVVSFVIGHTLASHGPTRDDDRSAPVYQTLDPAKFPALLEAAPVLDERDVDAELELGLDVLLVGLASKLRGARK
jgi:AcrR family transcriptional regulator